LKATHCPSLFFLAISDEESKFYNIDISSSQARQLPLPSLRKILCQSRTFKEAQKAYKMSDIGRFFIMPWIALKWNKNQDLQNSSPFSMEALLTGNAQYG
jgi:hypothetical protein